MNKAYVFLVMVFVTANCTDSDNPTVGNGLFETNHSLVGAYYRYLYINGRVDRITMVADAELPYLKVNYQGAESDKIATITYGSDTSSLQQKDTLVYSAENLSQITTTYKTKGLITNTYTTYFVYDQVGHLISAESGSRRIELVEYQNSNCTRAKTYAGSNLISEFALRYNLDASPFSRQTYLNLALFNLHNLEGFEFLSNNNVIERVESDHESVVYTTTYVTKYFFDAKGRPIETVTTRMGDSQYQRAEFYRYR